MKIRQITVIGLGLIGGSLAWAIKDKGLAKVVGYARRPETVKEALKKGIVDEASTDLLKSVKGSELIFICTSIDSIVDIVEQIAEHIEKEAIIVDTASTKEEIVHQLDKRLPEGVTFLGGHPMAGSEKTGIESASKDLFNGARFILTPFKMMDNKKIRGVATFVEKLGMNVEYFSAEDHDAAVAAVSHLPYLLSTVLVNTVGTHPGKESFVRVASSGFRDTTRVASSAPEWGREVAGTNKENILAMISAFKDQLAYLEIMIKLNKGKELKEFFESAKKIRSQFVQS